MQLKDYEYYQKTSEGGCKSQMKDFINLYSKILKRVKKESASELDGVKINIKRRYPQEVYLTLIDEKDELIKLTLTEKTKEYVIPIFTDVCEYDEGSEKLTKLFLDKMTQKVISAEDIKELGENDKYFKGIIINPHSQNFRMDTEGNI
ncbi:hypothetical protein [Methanobrevibacter millerae]|jgi:hypothetical protein|uniref:SseB protein N-terminal domain-containing protein n=1 Tax=Methanobrevibacter millerae TaxID=230361 RepID=A0A0U2TTA8_9EURY|nr:hypothetical protein [Methanobrevibacter millerae]ALT69091.1 hypothetical protein sm9_1310 [Methanobrevibacter millerae]MBO6275310.1 hypothetical protein [Methanobrevibacter sp.]